MKCGHLGFAVKDLQASKHFYREAFAPIGLSIIGESAQSVRFGADGRTMVFIHTHTVPGNSLHLAFEVETRGQVDSFYTAALSAGGKDNGSPGVREHYSPTYYAAFVIDPDGNNIETVCR